MSEPSADRTPPTSDTAWSEIASLLLELQQKLDAWDRLYDEELDELRKELSRLTTYESGALNKSSQTGISTMAISRQTMAAAQPMGKTSELGGVAQLVDVILDKGIVIDAWVRVSVVGLEVLTIEARVMVASVDTYLRYAEALGRIASAAPLRQPSASGGTNDQDRVLEGQVLRRLSEHLEGLQPASLQALLDAPVEQLRTILSHLTREQKVRRDDEHSFYHPDRP